jgi:uncharacterized membrane protein
MNEDHENGADRPIFRAVLTPHRSLGRKGFNRLMIAMALLSVFVGIAFLSQGAWPIVGFFGLDVFILWVALRASYRSGRASEEVRVSRTELRIRKTSPAGAVTDAIYNPFFARLLVSRHQAVGVAGIAVTGAGRTTEVGAFLEPDARPGFAREFGRALSQARAG